MAIKRDAVWVMLKPWQKQEQRQMYVNSLPSFTTEKKFVHRNVKSYPLMKASSTPCRRKTNPSRKRSFSNLFPCVSHLTAPLSEPGETLGKPPAVSKMRDPGNEVGAFRKCSQTRGQLFVFAWTDNISKTELFFKTITSTIVMWLPRPNIPQTQLNPNDRWLLRF